jgi:hypothetical protein
MTCSAITPTVTSLAEYFHVLKKQGVEPAVYRLVRYIVDPSCAIQNPLKGFGRKHVMFDLYRARFGALQSFYTFVLEEKKVKRSLDLGLLAHKFTKTDYQSARILFEDDGRFAGAAVQLALWELYR